MHTHFVAKFYFYMLIRHIYEQINRHIALNYFAILLPLINGLSIIPNRKVPPSQTSALRPLYDEFMYQIKYKNTVLLHE